MEQKKSCSWNIKTHYLRFKHFIFNCNLKLEDNENVPIKNNFWKDLIKCVWIEADDTFKFIKPPTQLPCEWYITKFHIIKIDKPININILTILVLSFHILQKTCITWSKVRAWNYLYHKKLKKISWKQGVEESDVLTCRCIFFYIVFISNLDFWNSIWWLIPW
jgi:hypothetical protein